MFLDQRVQQRPSRIGQFPLVLEDLAQRRCLVQDPGLHRGDQGIARDEIHLQGDHPEQKVAVGGSA